MNEQPVTIRQISWRDLCPWTIIFKTLPIAAGITVLLWSTLGVLLASLGWLACDALFLNDDTKASNPALSYMSTVNKSPYGGVFQPMTEENSVEVFGAKLSGPRMVFEQITRPFTMLFSGHGNVRAFLYVAFGSLFSLIVWCFFGCAIARVCLLRLTRDEPSSLDDALDFALEKFKDCLIAIAMPLSASLLLCIPTFIIGLFMGFDFGVIIAGILWFIVLAISSVIVLLLLGLLFGFPLMVSSVAAEGQNSFDAMTRAYAYTFQRPLNYIFYMMIAILFGGFCWLVVGGVTNSVVKMSYWSTSWGANRFGEDRIDYIMGTKVPTESLATKELQVGETGGETVQVVTSSPSSSGSMRYGRKIIGFWNGVLRTISAAFLYGLFWCMASAIYLLLRKDVDDTELDEIFQVDEKRTYDLPPLKSDELGIPQIQEPVAQQPESPETDEPDS